MIRYCPSCFDILGTNFCKRCGHQAAYVETRCANLNCRQHIDSTFKFCSECGTVVSEQTRSILGRIETVAKQRDMKPLPGKCPSEPWDLPQPKAPKWTLRA